MTFNWNSLIFTLLTWKDTIIWLDISFWTSTRIKVLQHRETWNRKKQQHDFEVRRLSVTGSCSHHSYNMAQRIIHEATLISNSTKVENLTIFGKNEVWMKEKCAEGRWDLSFNLRPRVKRSFTAVVLLSDLLWTWYTCVV